MSETTKPEEVDHPKHYNAGRFEVIEVLKDWGFEADALLWNAIKYIARHKHKSDPLEDLKKARWYLDRRIQEMEAAEQHPTMPEAVNACSTLHPKDNGRGGKP